MSESASDLIIRRGTIEDANACGTICYQAFKRIADTHNFVPDLPSVELAIGLIQSLLSHPGFYSLVAEIDGRIVGSNFLDERCAVAGLGPISIDPLVQNRRIGRQLMEKAHERAAEKRFTSVRLVQAGYHTRSLALYAGLGYEVREPLACINGEPLNVALTDCPVRLAVESDTEACNRVCERVHGHNRGSELDDMIRRGTATVVEREGRVTGYATVVGFFGHAVGESNRDLEALIGSAQEFAGPGFLLPTRNGELFRWCLQHGLRVTQPMTLMSKGSYNEPAGAFLPSILY